MNLRSLIALFLVSVSWVCARAETPKFTDLVAEEGRCAFTDDTSIYWFYKDGSFRLGPKGLCGRTIDGRWTTKDGRTFVIVGKWALANGISRSDDYRRLTLSVVLKSDQAIEPDKNNPFVSFKTYPVSLTVGEEESITKQEYDASKQAIQPDKKEP